MGHVGWYGQVRPRGLFPCSVATTLSHTFCLFAFVQPSANQRKSIPCIHLSHSHFSSSFLPLSSLQLVWRKVPTQNIAFSENSRYCCFGTAPTNSLDLWCCVVFFMFSLCLLYYCLLLHLRNMLDSELIGFLNYLRVVERWLKWVLGWTVENRLQGNKLGNGMAEIVLIAIMDYMSQMAAF